MDTQETQISVNDTISNGNERPVTPYYPRSKGVYLLGWADVNITGCISAVVEWPNHVT